MSNEINQRVVTQAERRRGQQVGTGECFDFADRVLRAAGARSAADYGPVTPTADYVWGAELTNPAAALPGDIIQMRDVVIEWREDYDDGSWKEYTEEFPHHTAIVIQNMGDGRLRILHQNFQGVRRVTEHVLRLSDRTQGIVWAYRPEPR